MGKVFTPENINSGFNTNNSLNTNFGNIETALEDCLSRSGAAPNAMSAALDMNNNDILNVGAIDVASITVDGAAIPSLADVQAAQAASEAARDLAQGYATDASTSATGAAQYAIEPEDSEIAPGIYSALHYAAKAAASAAGVNLPSLGLSQANKVLRVNSLGDDYELVAANPAAEPSSIMMRGVDGRSYISAVPDSEFHVVNKAYVDSELSANVSITGFTRSVAAYRTNDANLPGDELNVIASMSEGATTTVGPTGSGATVIWARLNGVPSNAKTVSLKCVIGGYDSTIPSNVYTDLRVGDSSSNVLSHKFYNNDTADKLITVETEVVLQSSNILTLQWLSTATNPSIKVYLTGFTI